MLRSCHTCRQRRRGCDRAKPACNTCFKDGFECGGYSKGDNVVYVHHDTDNIATNKKRLLLQAIKASSKQRKSKSPVQLVERRGTSLYTPKARAEREILSNSIRCLDLTEVDFQHHVRTLWNHFNLGHSRTADAWAPALLPLISANRYLDLAAIALSSLRFGISTKDDRMRAMSMTAYGKSLRIFGNLSYQEPIQPCVYAQFATTALMYTLFEATFHTPATVFSSGALTNSPHLNGAMVFMQACGAQGFSDEKSHLAFKKIREMIVLDAFYNYRPSFLAEPPWLTKPWLKSSKTDRDRLFDIASQMTTLVPVALSPLASTESKNPNLSKSTILDRIKAMYLELRAKLAAWQGTWLGGLSTDSLDFLAKLRRNPSEIVPDEQTVSLLYLQLELWTMQLLLGLCFACSMPYQETVKDPHLTREFFEYTSSSIRATLMLPTFCQITGYDQGIVEGQCRSLIAAWSLIEYDRYTKTIAPNKMACRPILHV